MREQIPLREAAAEFVHDGDVVAIEGTTHLVPFAAAHELSGASAHEAGAMHLSLAVLHGHTGVIEAPSQQRFARIRCPFTGEQAAAVRNIRPDVTLIHAQEADRRDHVLATADLAGFRRVLEQSPRCYP